MWLNRKEILNTGWGHVYFEPVRQHIIYQALTYLKSYNEFYDDISITKGLSSKEIIRFSHIEENVSDGKEITENINDRSEPEFASIEGPLSMHRTGSNETIVVFEIPNIIIDKNIVIPPAQKKRNSFSFKR